MSNEKVNFLEFAWYWNKLQGYSTPSHQQKMINWLEKTYHKDNRQALLMAFRNSGKSTIVGLFCSWILYVNPDMRILVLAADYALAKKMVRNVKRIIEQHPLTLGLKPARLGQWASDQFTINRDLELRDPSMLAKGLNANITGLRADIIICDDVEVPKTSDNAYKRGELKEKLAELDFVLVPSGMILYIGTPHSYYTIYRTKEEDEGGKDYNEEQPFLLGFDKLKIPILNSVGKSNWENRFSVEKISSIRIRSGENKFQSQMMLKPVNITEGYFDISRLTTYESEINYLQSNGENALTINDKKMLSVSCCWDPSFAISKDGKSKSDDSVVACVFTDSDGKYWLHDIEYIKVDYKDIDESASLQCQKIVEFIKRNFIPSIQIETNGIGKFLPGLLKKELSIKNISCAVLEKHNSKNKEQRIIEALEVILANKALNINKKIYQTNFIAELREWTPIGNKNKDDAIDAVASCIISEPIRIPRFDSKKAMKHNWQGGVNPQFQASTKFNL